MLLRNHKLTVFGLVLMTVGGIGGWTELHGGHPSTEHVVAHIGHNEIVSGFNQHNASWQAIFITVLIVGVLIVFRRRTKG